MLKFSTLDPFGMGVEMEGGKPGWNDAMNGLPGTTGIFFRIALIIMFALAFQFHFSICNASAF